MPITPLLGSRSSPRIRTSRSPRSSAPRRAGRSCARAAAGACSVPPARPTESIGTPMAAHGADTREGYRRPCGVSAAARRRSGRRSGSRPARRRSSRRDGWSTRRSASRRGSRGPPGPPGARTRPRERRTRARGADRREDLVGVEAAVVPHDQARPARGREIGDHPVAAGGRDVRGAPKRAEASVDATRTRAWAPSKPVHATWRRCRSWRGRWAPAGGWRCRARAAGRRGSGGRRRTATSSKTAPCEPPSLRTSRSRPGKRARCRSPRRGSARRRSGPRRSSRWTGSPSARAAVARLDGPAGVPGDEHVAPRADRDGDRADAPVGDLEGAPNEPPARRRLTITRLFVPPRLR